jgi:hypothetical protein
MNALLNPVPQPKTPQPPAENETLAELLRQAERFAGQLAAVQATGMM